MPGFSCPHISSALGSLLAHLGQEALPCLARSPVVSWGTALGFQAPLAEGGLELRCKCRDYEALGEDGGFFCQAATLPVFALALFQGCVHSLHVCKGSRHNLALFLGALRCILTSLTAAGLTAGYGALDFFEPCTL